MTSTRRHETFSRFPYDWEERQKWLDLPFPVEEYEGRLARLQASMAREKIGALIVYGGANDIGNLHYLAHFDNSWGHSLLVVPASGEPVLVTNGIFHAEPIHSNVHTTWVKDIRPALSTQSAAKPTSVAEIAAGVVKEIGAASGTVGIVGERTIPHPLHAEIASFLPAARLVPATSLVARLRAVKTPREIALLREGSKVIDRAFEAAVAAARPGATEAEISAEAARVIVAAGGQCRLPHVMTGARSCLKNAYPNQTKVKDGDVILYDFVGQFGGYYVDFARNVALGKQPDLVQRMLDACLRANEEVGKKIGPGVPIVDLQKMMARIFEEGGVAEYGYPYTGFGHGGGLDILEAPFLYEGNPEPLRAGMTFYLEPMILAHGVAGVCIEDMVAVTEGGVDYLTNARRRFW
ncbi:MAG: aminopeptidase P family protein [Armatimonadetes bacterium]|nr:aminopeptidase P family protein [Armatimonadota bacterium]